MGRNAFVTNYKGFDIYLYSSDTTMPINYWIVYTGYSHLYLNGNFSLDEVKKHIDNYLLGLFSREEVSITETDKKMLITIRRLEDGTGYIINTEMINDNKNKEVWVYDYDKLNELIRKYGEIEVGMRTDWFFTAETVNAEFPSNAEFDKIASKPFESNDARFEPFKIAGIFGSRWDVPVAKTLDGEVEVYRRMRIIKHPDGKYSLEEIKEGENV